MILNKGKFSSQTISDILWTRKEIIITSLVAGVLLYLFLIMYQPFGTSQFEHPYKYLLLFPYAVITALSFYSVLLFARNKRKWTLGSEVLKSFFILLLISLCSYLYNSLFLSEVYLSFENYLYMFAYTLALGLPVFIMYIMARYIYLTKTAGPAVDMRRPESESVLKTENLMDSEESDKKLYITSEYGNFHLEIEQRDFIYAETMDNYCRLYFYKNGVVCKEVIRISMSNLLIQIQTSSIKRIHRSFIVNLHLATKFKGNASGYKISLNNIQKELAVSRNYIDTIVPFL